jgi:Lar family restriction alleviation protein
VSGPVDVLLPCPFCGGEARLREETTAPKDCHHYVDCKACGICTVCQPDAEIAHAAWNRRSENAAVAELVEASIDYFGPLDDPSIGWLREGATPDTFKCERCGAEHRDCSLIPHIDGCRAVRLRDALANVGSAS